MSWNELSLKDKADYIKESVNNGIYNLSNIRNRYNMYAEGGYIPSNKIKKDIANWEGSEMKRNVPFSEVTRQFNATIPASIRAKLSSNQLDALYSYGYNVGMGNLKKRVLPTLNNYVKGKATNEDVQRSMWASRDNELRGLTRRRNWEREMFGGNYRTIFTGTGGTPNNYNYSIKSNTNTNTKVNPYQIQNEEWQGKNYLAAYKGLQLSMNDIMGKTKEDDIDDLFSTGTGPIISMDNLLSIGNNTVAPVQPDYSYAKSLLSDFDSDLNSNMFDEGGNMDNNRTAMPAHPATNPYKRRSWETDEEYKERIQDLDNKSQEAALNDSTAINKYKEWEANIQKQQKINEEKSKAITIEKNTKRAKTLEKEFNSLRNIPSQMSPNDTIQVINKNIPEAYKQQYINNINMYKPALDTIDLGINLYSLYNPTVPVLSAGLLIDGLQFAQSIVDEDLGVTDYSALVFDTLGLLGATNKLPTRLRIGKNRFWDVDKTADYLGAGHNIIDSAIDVYDLGKTGYYLYNNKGNNNLYISPFKKSFDEGGNLSYIDADNRRSNILLHTEDGNLYDSAGNNYTQSYLDEENVPIIKGTMPRNTRQYYDPNTTLEFINAATAPISNFSPSNIVGSIREARDYNTFMNSFMNQDNTGFFTKEYAKEHPYISTLGNLGGDILAGIAFDKGIDLYRLGKQAFKEELPYLSTIAKSRLYSDNPIINTYATYARRFNLPDKARLPYLIRRWKPEEIQPIINNELQINGNRLGHTNFTWDRAVISHNKGKWDKGAQTLLINPRELIARNKNNWGSIEPMDMFTITDNGNGFRVPTKDVTIISGNLNTLADAASNNIRTATSKLLQQDEKRIAEDVGESLGRFNLNRDPRRGFDNNMYNHANEIIKRFGFPKIKDVKLLEKLTGLKSYTVPFDKQKKAFIEKLKNFKNLSLNEAEELLENNSNFPNGTPINITSAGSIDKRNLTKFDFNNLFYDPATMAEHLFFNQK